MAYRVTLVGRNACFHEVLVCAGFGIKAHSAFLV